MRAPERAHPETWYAACSKMKAPRTPVHDFGAARGMALISVLWVLTLLMMVTSIFTVTTHTSTRVSSNLIESAKAKALADAGIFRAIHGIMHGDQGDLWSKKGPISSLRLIGGETVVHTADERLVISDYLDACRIATWLITDGAADE